MYTRTRRHTETLTPFGSLFVSFVLFKTLNLCMKHRYTIWKPREKCLCVLTLKEIKLWNFTQTKIVEFACVCMCVRMSAPYMMGMSWICGEIILIWFKPSSNTVLALLLLLLPLLLIYWMMLENITKEINNFPVSFDVTHIWSKRQTTTT